MESCFPLGRRLARLMMAFALLVVAAFSPAQAATHEADVCVYGGTSGGVVAAVQAARMGKRVILMEPGRHLGGMTSGGLCAVDIGDPRSVGGLAREYFTRLVAGYGKVLSWDQPFRGKGGPATGGAYSIEPHTAERVFDQMAEEAGVVVLKEARLKSARKEGARIVELVTESGDRIRAGMFVDTTYEGDLMDAAGVSYTLMREGNAQYGETYNGIHYSEKYRPREQHGQPGANGRVKGGQGAWDRDFPLNPFVIKGDPSSGLLPLVNEGGPGVPGEAAPGVQAYCFRLCLTTDPGNMIPIGQPAGYDPKNYELVVRFIEACLAHGDTLDLRWFSKHDPLPNNKWDFNTATFGGNLPGASWEWPEASYDRREEIARHIENYHRGLLYFLAHDPRVPETVRVDAQRFGLPRDEFQDSGGWPHQLYIREGRRMVSDLVLTEHHTYGREVAPHSVGLGSYGTDVHEIRRIVKDGVVTREGKLGAGRGGAPPYAIGYGAIVPKLEECENLFVTFALSASHTAFASIRMEPVFMVTSQSAATAACLALDTGKPVQAVDYNALEERLLADGQVLSWPPGGERKLPGVVLDDREGKLVGSWSPSNRNPSIVGSNYLHDGNKDRGKKSITFASKLANGRYEVRLFYSSHVNRSSKTKVTIRHADGTSTVVVNQQQPVLVNGIPKALGTFRFEADSQGSVEVSNEGATGYVEVDGIQFLPESIAKEERSGKRKVRYAVALASADAVTTADARDVAAAAVAVSPLARETAPARKPTPSAEPVLLAKPTPASEVAGRSYDVVVVGGTGSGIMCAVRAAREGCQVLLVQHNGHIGGMMVNGLMQWDAHYGGPRSPLFSELLDNIEQHYIRTFGEDSPNHQRMRYTHQRYPIGWAEPHVAEREFNRLVAGEPNITLLLNHYPEKVARKGSQITDVTLRAREVAGGGTIQVKGTTFVDATYEGDLFALADVPYRVGREARDEYHEPHAGKIFVNIDHTPPTSPVKEGLNIYTYSAHQGSIDPTSPFTADGAVQAYNYRFCITSDPANRLPIPKPEGYSRETYLNYDRHYLGSKGGPNSKAHVNSPILPGKNHAYPEASWKEREAIIKHHLDFGLGLMWFLQHDESILPRKQAEYVKWGLPKDEYADHGHVPYEMYVREARRIVGRHVYTEHDNSIASDYARTPIHPDSIAVTDWYMDSHACTTDSRPGFQYDGKLILTEESRPGQIPYRSLLPRGVDNLLVPVCLSATHVAWGAIRLEPVFMQTGEAAGFAAALARKKNVAAANLDTDELVRTLVKHRQLVSFFNDTKLTDSNPAILAAQYFGTHGFFADYNARLDDPLTAAVTKAWTKGFTDLRAGNLDSRQLATAVQKAEASDSPITRLPRGEVLLRMWRELNGEVPVASVK